MNTVGAVVFDKPIGNRPFGFDVTKPTRVRTVHGNFRKGFWVRFEDTGVEVGPYDRPEIAEMIARRWDGLLERANG